jgi:hypothetical protein
MDYDKTDIARTYNQARHHGTEFLELWMNTVATHLGPISEPIDFVVLGTQTR